MSFKRDGDDNCALNTQRRQRVAELLCEEIQNDEVTRLSNGKFACKLCMNSPVFDTLNMFYVHRQGKKHQISVQYQIEKQRELDELITRRAQEQHLKSQEFNTNQTHVKDFSQQTTSKMKVDGKIQRQRKPYDRKPAIDLENGADKHTGCNTQVSIETTLPAALPRNRSVTKNISKGNFANNKPVTKAQYSSKNQFDKRESYCHGNKGLMSSNLSSADNILNTKHLKKFVGDETCEQNLKYYQARKQQKLKIENETKSLEEAKKLAPLCDPFKSWEYYKDRKDRRIPVTISKKQETSSQSYSRMSSQSEHSISSQSKLSSSSALPSHSMVADEKRERAEKHLKAFGSGWKKDWDGRWIKDEDAEFDSDEEPPDVV